MDKKHLRSKQSIQFVLFGDIVTGSDCWFYDLKRKKLNFVDKLKKLGDVVVLKPNYVNFMRYSKSKNGASEIFAPKRGTINFTIEDLQFENYADWVYGQIDKNKKYIAIGLDQGAHFAKYFVNKYNSNCVALFILTDRILTKENYERLFNSSTYYDGIKSRIDDTNWMKYKIENITNDTISELLDNITSKKNNENYINLLNGICKGIVRSQYNKITKMKVKTIIYSDIKSATPEKIEDNIKFSKKSDGKVIYYYIIDDSYYFFHGRYKDEIYDRICGLIQNM